MAARDQHGKDAPWGGLDDPAKKRFQVVGHAHRKIDGLAKATGQAVYADDIVLPGMLHAKILRSPHAHANIRGIDASEALAMEGVHAVLTGDELPVKYGVIPWTPDENALAVDKVRFIGDEVAAVAAIDEDTANAALELIDVDYEVLPAFLDPREALETTSPQIHETPKKPERGNLSKRVELAFGDGTVRLTLPGQSFWFRLLDGEFPDYEAVVPTDNKVFAMLQRDALLSALRRVSILVADRAKAVRFAFGEEELEIQVHNVDRGEVRETVPMELTGDELEVGFNARYLQEILGVMKGEHVVLELAHPLAPCLVKDPDDSDCFFVVMPMRLD